MQHLQFEESKIFKDSGESEIDFFFLHNNEIELNGDR
jgi:hypothetical protein